MSVIVKAKLINGAAAAAIASIESSPLAMKTASGYAQGHTHLSHI